MKQEVVNEYGEKQMHIIEAAETLFATKGFDGTSVRDIAHDAGVNLAMISYYFGSKEKLLEAVFEIRTSFYTSQLEEMLKDEHLSHVEKIEKLVDSYVHKMMGFQQFHKIMVREQIAEKETSITGLIHQMKKKNHELIKKLIQSGQKAGDFKKNIDISLMMTTMIGTANQLISTQHHYRDLNNLQHLSEGDFQKLIKKKLTTHLKTLFKSILTHE